MPPSPLDLAINAPAQESKIIKEPSLPGPPPEPLDISSLTIVDPNYVQKMELGTKSDFDATLANAGSKLVVIDFYATWCPPCRTIAPQYVELANNLAGTVVMVKVDIDENRETKQFCNVKCMPTF